MSRTYKDRPDRLRFPDHREPKPAGYDRAELSRWLALPRSKSKVPRYQNTKWFWYKAAPGWWVRLMMTRPQRRRCRMWEQQTKTRLDFEDADCPVIHARRPHVYFY